MDGIPAASIRDIDWKRVEMLFPSMYRELQTLSDKLDDGAETIEDLLRLSEALFFVGELNKAERLLIANSREGDEFHSLYIRLFGTDLEKIYVHSIHIFESQFGVILQRIEALRYLCNIYQVPLGRAFDLADCQLGALLAKSPQVQITLYSRAEIVADLYSSVSSESKLLRFHDEHWEDATAS